ncbi:MAG TPA: YhfC family glutamic-type intramembrane protease [Anaerolineales bacterium]|nr:YhfC family glutamic-type intramembrane protease [Anaerolineales bacterium]
MLILAYIVSVFLMVTLPIALAAWLRRISPAAWLLFAIGCLTFILSQVVHLPLNDWLGKLGLLPAESVSELPLWRTALTLGLTAGLCEELARAVGYALIQRFKPLWMRLQDSLMLGLGHGGIESMIFGGVLTAASLSSLLPLRGSDLSSLGLKPEQLEILRLQLNLATSSPWNAALPLIERLLAISAHVVFSVLVWKAFAARRLGRDWFYILLAIAYHAAVDAAVVWGAQTIPERSLLRMGIFAGTLLPGWIWAFWLARQGRAGQVTAIQATTGTLDGSLRGEIGVFWIAFLKEMRQLWRTKRLLVMVAVFLLFGMGSPLIAKFTPLAFSSIEGMEVFAEMIPEPTAGDALAQYIKNLSQFGFILAVLMAMGVVVGEKERGVAPMIISKPMSRWAFVSSKLAAQALMYLVGFILAGVGAYYYTLFLFGPLALGDYALLNGLMILWLLVFVALSLLGSTLAGSTVAAGGIGLGLSVVLMLVGTLPRYGALLPGGLLGWATQLGQRAAGVAASLPGSAAVSGQLMANGGAAASALVVILMSLVLAIGIFEQQEL